MKGTTSDARTGVQVRPELFVAYAESDSEWVHGFLLPELGLDPQSVLTPQDFTPGADYRTVIRGPDLPGTSIPVVLRRADPVSAT